MTFTKLLAAALVLVLASNADTQTPGEVTIKLAVGLQDPNTPQQAELVLLEKTVGDGEQIPVHKAYDGTAQGAVDATQEFVAHGFRVVQ